VSDLTGKLIGVLKSAQILQEELRKEVLPGLGFRAAVQTLSELEQNIDRAILCGKNLRGRREWFLQS